MKFMRHLNGLERVRMVQNTIPDELERCLFKKSKARVAKHNDLQRIRTSESRMFAMNFLLKVTWFSDNVRAHVTLLAIFLVLPCTSLLFRTSNG